MIKKIATGMAIMALALTGCVDNKEIKARKAANKSITKDIVYLKACVKAVETACLQLHDRICDLELQLEHKSDHSEKAEHVQAETTLREVNPDQPAGANTIPPETEPQSASLTETQTHPLLTPDSFSYTITGMKPNTITKILGKPDRIKKVANNETWIYSRIRLQGVHGGSETTPAMVVFENGRVTHGILTKDIQYNFQIKKQSETGRELSDQMKQ